MICMFKQIHHYLQMFFEKFRDTCIEIYGLDPSHFLTVPGLAWQLRLKKKHANLELLTDHVIND